MRKSSKKKNCAPPATGTKGTASLSASRDMAGRAATTTARRTEIGCQVPHEEMGLSEYEIDSARAYQKIWWDRFYPLFVGRSLSWSDGRIFTGRASDRLQKVRIER